MTPTPLMPVEEALDRVLSGIEPLPGETIALSLGLGRVLARDLAARRTQPPDDVSAMDGYAMRGADIARTPFDLACIGDIKAGDRMKRTLAPGECARIFTGAPLPSGADTVVIQEDTSRTGDTVTVTEPITAERHVRKAGGDFREGDVLLRAGRVLTARDIGLLSAMNWPWIPVVRRPRVAILSTGDEIVMPGEPIGESQIVSANGPALAAFVTALGGDPLLIGIAPDRTDALGAFIEAASGADLLLTTGGASVGEHDLVQRALTESGMTLEFWRIAMRPGKPLIFGRIGATPVLGLPGNPVSSQVCAMLFAAPLLRARQGIQPTIAPPFTATLAAPMKANDRRQDYVRASLETAADGRVTATPFEVQDSAMLALLAKADGLIVRPPHAPAAQAGETVHVMRFEHGLASL